MQSAQQNKRFECLQGAVYILRCACTGKTHEVPLNGVGVRCPDCGMTLRWPPKPEPPKQEQS